MLSIGKVGPGGAGYYTNQVARGAEDYYLGAGEAPGRWVGAGVGLLDLDGEVDDTAFARLLDGCDPRSGKRLVAGGDGRLAGLDLTLSAPKSVSVLGALHPDPVVRAAVAYAHEAAVADALGYIESDGLWARRGRNGRQRVRTRGLVAAAFGHRASRAGDPQLHTHVVVANLVADREGRWSAPDSRSVYRHARTAGYLYQARLRAELTASLGVRWGPVRNGQADLSGVGRDSIERFSTRRAQITASLQQRGLSSANAARVAAVDTRPAKPSVNGVGLADRWQHVAADAAIDLSGVVGPPRVAGLGAERTGRLLDRLGSPDGLTARSSTFDRRDVYRALAEGHPDGATVDQLRVLAARLVAGDSMVGLGDDTEATTGMAARWTTVELLAVEADIAARARNSTHLGAGVAEAVAVADALRARPQLSREQVDLVETLCWGQAGVQVVVGRAGAGKTFALDAARHAWQSSGITVVGAAVAARAAAELQAGSAIASVTLARLLADLDRPEGRLAAGSVIVVDEASMVGTRALHQLLCRATEQQAKVVLVGDPAQLPEIDAGGAFARLAADTGPVRLVTNRRQVHDWERQALDLLRDRQPVAAIGRYGDHQRITIADTAPQLRDQMVADWHTAHHQGRSAVMLAVRRADVADLNARAQASRVAAGHLDPARGALEVGERRYVVGDEIVCGRNDRHAGLINGTRLTITALDPDTRTITGIDPIGATVEVPGRYVDQGHVALGYAMTVYKAQGATVDEAFLLGDDRLFAEAGYVGLSRGRASNRIYVVAGAEPVGPASPTPGATMVDHLTDALGVSRAQTLSTAAVADHTNPAAPLSVLIPARDRLVTALLADMPPRHIRPHLDPSGPVEGRHLSEQLGARDIWTAGHRRDGERLARLAAAVDRRVEHLTTAALIDPPDHLTRLLGRPPDDRGDRLEWAQTAGQIETWRDLTGRSPDRGSRHLLAEPGRRGSEHEWWAQTARAVERYQTRHHHLSERAALLDADLSRDDGLDRSWAPANQKGLSR